jgi:hypothetical protein
MIKLIPILPAMRLQRVDEALKVRQCSIQSQ